MHRAIFILHTVICLFARLSFVKWQYAAGRWRATVKSISLSVRFFLILSLSLFLLKYISWKLAQTNFYDPTLMWFTKILLGKIKIVRQALSRIFTKVHTQINIHDMFCHHLFTSFRCTLSHVVRIRFFLRFTQYQNLLLFITDVTFLTYDHHFAFIQSFQIKWCTICVFQHWIMWYWYRYTDLLSFFSLEIATHTHTKTIIKKTKNHQEEKKVKVFNELSFIRVPNHKTEHDTSQSKRENNTAFFRFLVVKKRKFNEIINLMRSIL